MTTDPRTVIRDKVAEAIWGAWESDLDDPTPWLDAGPVLGPLVRNLADAAIAAHLQALEQAARIESVEQLALEQAAHIESVEQLAEALPGTVIRVGDGPSAEAEHDQ